MVAADLPQCGPHYASRHFWHVSHAEAAGRFYPLGFRPKFEFQYGNTLEPVVGGDFARHDFADDHAASVCLVEEFFGLGAFFFGGPGGQSPLALPLHLLNTLPDNL